MTLKEFEFLEKVFGAEIDVRTPYPLYTPPTRHRVTAVAASLLDQGFICKAEIRDGILLLRGYMLTEPGRIAFCEECSRPIKGSL